MIPFDELKKRMYVNGRGDIVIGSGIKLSELQWLMEFIEDVITVNQHGYEEIDWDAIEPVYRKHYQPCGHPLSAISKGGTTRYCTCCTTINQEE